MGRSTLMIDMEYTRRYSEWVGKKVPINGIVQSLIPEGNADTWFFLSSNSLSRKEKRSKERMWGKWGRVHWSKSIEHIGGDLIALMGRYHGYHRSKDVPTPPMIVVTDSTDVLDRVFEDSFLNCEQAFVGVFMDAHVHERDGNFLDFKGRHYGLNAGNRHRIRDISVSECCERIYPLETNQEEFFDPLT